MTMNQSTLMKDSDPAEGWTKKSNHSEHNPKPSTWWQWLLVYPTIIITLIGAIPTFLELYQAWNRDIPFGMSRIASEENKLWKKNFECSKGEFISVKNSFNIEVGTIICRSGDVLLRIQAPGQESIFRWVGLDSLTPKKMAVGDLFINSAYANSANGALAPILLAQASPTVLCQRWITSSKLLRRVSIQGQGCFDEIVNTYNGQVEQRNSAPCNQKC